MAVPGVRESEGPVIETTDEAVTYLEMVARRESGDLAEAALIVTRTLRQATQTLADHAQAAGVPGVREGDGAGVSDEALRRLAEKLYGEPALGIYAGLCRVAEEVAEEARREEQKRIEPLIWMAWRDLEWHRCRGAKPAMVPMLAPSVCRELLRAAGVDPDGPPPPEVESYQRRIKGEER